MKLGHYRMDYEVDLSGRLAYDLDGNKGGTRRPVAGASSTVPRAD